MLINKIISIAFRFIFFTMIVSNYYYFIIYTWLPISIKNYYAWIIIFIFHFSMIMLLWCLFTTHSADPGQVPLYWGFFLGDSDSKRRRYCLMCNVFKPDRCHHCSLCNRCVLNMDHHCPWINACIGYFNRKYFIQMLFYLIFTLYFILLANSKFTFEIIYKIIKNKISIKNDLTRDLLVLLIYFSDLGMSVVLTLFFRFHLTLVFENKTTIETIDKKGIEFESVVIF